MYDLEGFRGGIGIFMILISLVYNQLKLRILLRMSLLEQVLFQGVSHVSTVAHKSHTKHWL